MSAEPQPVAVVTGGARGIGEAIAAALIEAGYLTAVVDVNEKAIARAQATEAARDGRLVPLHLSITDRQAVERAMGELAATHGPIRALVNNAGMTLPGTFLDQTDDDWDRIVDVNLKGPFVISQVVARQMVQEKKGSIVNVSSVSAHGVRTGPPAYAAAKAGVEGLSRLMAVQLGPLGIRVNTVVVGTTATPWLLSRKTDEELDDMRGSNLLGRLGEPEDVAHTVAFLCSAAAKHLTGQLISVSGGQWMP
ncbi:SDR family NAD(P)-dependent oxidoreductase [Mycobacterium shimoidei]|uniref:SDR family NAD(P)-dependent oxidoreductase n=1 Tax=Mycobacterium shimoidei TaxID=29313 RepID=UPI00084900B8|nr:SDR family oxidoreductase [Mycobacterium shimoidei]MCV7257177.1 SDR family oxidoreductase [Mycobacterium shimoidei]ODR14474.1 short-chain dehydrogenase [Mycobacterium shimoidei]ORW80551.1 short-chain dehydrogenase [Mycobacterium shimoidei]